MFVHFFRIIFLMSSAIPQNKFSPQEGFLNLKNCFKLKTKTKPTKYTTEFTLIYSAVINFTSSLQAHLREAKPWDASASPTFCGRVLHRCTPRISFTFCRQENEGTDQTSSQKVKNGTKKKSESSVCLHK